MPNPIINFRLSPDHLARGLSVIRRLEPNYRLVSLSQIVKTCYFDYIAKMTLGHNDIVSPKIMEEIKLFIATPETETSLLDLIAKEKTIPKSENPKESTDSIITSLSDFSPPTDLLED